MNYSENTKKRQNAIKRQRWFRRMFTVALLMGILIGFVLGRISATAFEDKPTPAPEPTETAAWVVEKYGEQQIDIYFDNHEAACEFGLKYLNVYLKGEPET